MIKQWFLKFYSRLTLNKFSVFGTGALSPFEFKRLYRFVFSVLLFGLFGLFEGAAYANHTLPPTLQQALLKTKLNPENVSFYVVALDQQNPLIAWHEKQLHKPASVEKLLTTGSALLQLGADYRWHLDFYRQGEIKNGVLNGDLWIKSHGEPYLVEENLPEIIAGLNQHGIERINGNIILDDSYFLKEQQQAASFDGYELEPYNAIPNPFSINFQTLKLIFLQSQNGVRIESVPALSQSKIINQMRLNKAKKCNQKTFLPKIEQDKASGQIIISGSMARTCHGQQLQKVLADPCEIFYGLFAEAWQVSTGQQLPKRFKFAKVPDNAHLFFSATSKPLAEQIQPMNKLSNNLMTRQLFLTLGAVQYGEPATLAKGRKAVLKTLDSLGVNRQGLVVDNGAGLSRISRLSAEQLAQFLQKMSSSNMRFVFENSLSVMGVDGTLKHRLKNTPLAQNVVGKTGTLNDVRALAGYLTSASGKRFAFAAIAEGEQIGGARNFFDALLWWVYNDVAQ